MDNYDYFHFTLGPVQSFVAQARRTRDFWAGSFILSWLSAVAMREVEAQGGEVIFPAVDKKFSGWLCGEGQGKEEPRQGSVPNCFKAKVGTEFKPEQVVEAVHHAWRALANEVYVSDLRLLQFPNKVKTEEIWKRQIESFWDITWGIDSDCSGNAVMKQRKSWRTYMPPPEPGVKCMMMDGWQELSGVESPNPEDLKEFWGSVRKEPKGMKSDLDANSKGEACEWLSAIAFVKRRFVRHFENVNVEMPSGWKLKGWELPASVPSVTYMAAVHWLKKVLNGHDDESYKRFYEATTHLVEEHPEWDSNIDCIDKIRCKKKWKSIDGNLFFPTLLENRNLYPNQTQAQAVIKALSTLRKEKEAGAISPFYAVLMMDGDSLGKQMRQVGLQQEITDGLGRFTKEVPEIIKRNNGFLIYAGGDDVLAILPLEDALNCAAELRDYYQLQFVKSKATMTLSGAIEYVHIKVPLSKVLHDVHTLLDDIAKEATGRDALAIRVWKPGGVPVQWSQPWHVVVQDGAVVLNQLSEQFRQIDEGDHQFSNKFFYKIRERFSLLNPGSEAEKASVLDHDQAKKLLAMEYMNSGKSSVTSMLQAENIVAPLLEQCRPVYRDKKSQKLKASQYLLADGALLVRFLTHKGVAQ